MFKGKKKNEVEDIEEERFLERFRGADTPILILDERWLRIFPDNYKINSLHLNRSKLSYIHPRLFNSANLFGLKRKRFL